MTELPDPRDRSQPWCGDEPAYLAHYKARGNSEEHAYHWHELVGSYSQAIPTLTALKSLVTFSPLVEIGAGTGYWARLLKDLGADIIAYDLVKPESNSWTAKLPAWTEVRASDARTALQQHPNRVPFACWPPRPHGFMDDVLKECQVVTIALITDDRLMGDEDQPDPLYDVLENEWTLEQRVELPHWPYRTDSLMIWKRLENPKANS